MKKDHSPVHVFRDTSQRTTSTVQTWTSATCSCHSVNTSASTFLEDTIASVTKDSNFPLQTIKHASTSMSAELTTAAHTFVPILMVLIPATAPQASSFTQTSILVLILTSAKRIMEAVPTSAQISKRGMNVFVLKDCNFSRKEVPSRSSTCV